MSESQGTAVALFAAGIGKRSVDADTQLYETATVSRGYGKADEKV